MSKLKSKEIKKTKKNHFLLLKDFFYSFDIELISINITFYSIKLILNVNNKEEFIIMFKNDFYFAHKNCFSLINGKEVSFYLSNGEGIVSDIVKSNFEAVLVPLFYTSLFQRELFFLEKFIKKDRKLNKKILIYSDEKYIKPIKYLFYYTDFKNITFFSEENYTNDISGKFDTIVILGEPTCELLNMCINKNITQYKKIFFLGDISNDIYRMKNLEELLLNEKKLEIISNCYEDEKLEDKKNKGGISKNFILLKDQFNKIIKKFNYKYLYDFDLFGNIENSYILDEKKYDIDLLIPLGGGNRDFDIVKRNENFLKKYKCAFINISDVTNSGDIETEKNLKIINSLKKISSFQIFGRLSEDEYRKIIINSKVILIPSFIQDEFNWRSYTWGDVMMMGKYCLIGKTNRLLDFVKYNSKGIQNFDYYENDTDLINKLKLVLDNDRNRKKIESYAFSSYIKDLSIERILYKII